MNDLIQTPFSKHLLISGLVSPQQLAAARLVVGQDDRQLALHLVREGILTPFQARQLRAGTTGFTIGKYVVVDRLGRGGNSIVFKARHRLVPGRFVALKTLNTRSLHNGAEALVRFRREIEIVTRLDHPNVVRAHDVIETRTGLYLVLEFVEGSDLASLVRQRGPLPIAEAVGYAVQAAHGLAYAHAQGVIHRDLKPGNLLRTNDGVVKLSDLGLARLTTCESDVDLTTKGMCLGTPEFMAPEQVEDASRADSRSDLYGLGATLFHLLTAQLPVDGNSYMHRLKQLLTVPPRPLASARPDVPPKLTAIVDGLRARDPNDRPACAADAIALLEPFARWPAGENAHFWDGHRKAMLVLKVLRGQTSAATACQVHGLALEELERWGQCFLEGAEWALESAAQAKGPPSELLRDLHTRIGAQAKEIEELKRQLKEQHKSRPQVIL
jgi:serine/threonine-protein kinase